MRLLNQIAKTFWRDYGPVRAEVTPQPGGPPQDSAGCCEDGRSTYPLQDAPRAHSGLAASALVMAPVSAGRGGDQGRPECAPRRMPPSCGLQGCPSATRRRVGPVAHGQMPKQQGLKHASWRFPVLRIGGWDFEEPCSASGLRDAPGVYAVLDIRDAGASYACIDVGESDQVATRVNSHGREQCWSRNTTGRRAFAVLYTVGHDDGRRRQIEQDVRRSMSPPCGAF